MIKKSYVINTLHSIPSGLVIPDEGKNILLDSGCSHKVTVFEDSLEENSLESLQCPVTMTKISGTLIATYHGIDKYEVINKKGEVSVIICKYLYIPKLK